MDRWNLAVVVDGSQARFFSRRPFTLIETMENELGRTKNREMTDDKPGMGRSKGGGPSSTHALGSEKNPRRDAADHFAHEVCEEIEKLCYQQKPEHLLIVAEPRMKGLLRQHLAGHWEKRSHWLDKDLAHTPTPELQERLLNWMP